MQDSYGDVVAEHSSAINADGGSGMGEWGLHGS